MIQRSQIAADDEGAFINSEDFLLDSQKQTAVHAQVSSKNSAYDIFQARFELCGEGAYSRRTDCASVQSNCTQFVASIHTVLC